MSMMAISFTDLLQNSLEFRRSWRGTRFEGEPLAAALTSTDVLALGLLLQLSAVRAARIGNTALPGDLLRSGGEDSEGSVKSRAGAPAPRARFETLRVLADGTLVERERASEAAPSATPASWSNPACLTLIHADSGVAIGTAPPGCGPEIALRPLSSLAPALWACQLFLVVTPANRDAVAEVVAELRDTLGDPGLDPLYLYETLQRRGTIDPNEVARLRAEVSSLKISLADVQDHSRRFALSALAAPGAAQPQRSNGTERVLRPAPASVLDAPPPASDLEAVTRQLRYAHNQIAFLTTYLTANLPTKLGDRDLLARSPLFDAAWYAEKYRLRPRAALDHYLAHGCTGRFDPSPIFHSASYYAANLDVATEKLNPLIHYLRHGAHEGRPLAVPAGTPPPSHSV
jgi:hypothetical protein